MSGPGPNVFHPDNVVITEAGALELNIRLVEVLLNRSLGFGDYIVTIESDPWEVRYQVSCGWRGGGGGRGGETGGGGGGCRGEGEEREEREDRVEGRGEKRGREHK